MLATFVNGLLGKLSTKAWLEIVQMYRRNEMVVLTLFEVNS